MGAVVYLLAWRAPREFGLGNAFLILFLAAMATGSGESLREFLRKPFIVNGYLYSNGTRVKEVSKRNAEGYLAHSPWIQHTGPVYDAAALPAHEVGERMFQAQCMACHTVDGYRSMRKLLAGRDAKSIGNILQTLHENKPDSPYRRFMPPLVGSDREIEALKLYLDSLVNKAR
jgi:mono/diheme cytochrome c family protein